MSIKDIVGKEKYSEVRSVLAALLSEKDAAKIDDDLVDATLMAMIEQASRPSTDLEESVTAVRYYTAHSRHRRVIAPHTTFVGHLPMVRLPLPDNPTASVET